MFQAKLGGWKRLAASLMLLPGLTAVGAEMLHLLGTARAQQRSNDSAGPGAKAGGLVKRTNDDPRLLVKKAREALDNGRLEVALELARQAESNSSINEWRLFDDTPDAVIKDVQKALSRRDRSNSERMVSQARILFERNTGTQEQRAANLDKARSLCVEAMQLHGPYTMWHLGDRADMLLKEIDAARSKITVAASRPEPRGGADTAAKQRPAGELDNGAAARKTSSTSVARPTPKTDYYSLPNSKNDVAAARPGAQNAGYYEPPPGWGETDKKLMPKIETGIKEVGAFVDPSPDSNPETTAPAPMNANQVQGVRPPTSDPLTPPAPPLPSLEQANQVPEVPGVNPPLPPVATPAPADRPVVVDPRATSGANKAQAIQPPSAASRSPFNANRVQPILPPDYDAAQSPFNANKAQATQAPATPSRSPFNANRVQPVLPPDYDPAQSPFNANKAQATQAPAAPARSPFNANRVPPVLPPDYDAAQNPLNAAKAQAAQVAGQSRSPFNANRIQPVLPPAADSQLTRDGNVIPPNINSAGTGSANQSVAPIAKTDADLLLPPPADGNVPAAPVVTAPVPDVTPVVSAPNPSRSDVVVPPPDMTPTIAASASETEIKPPFPEDRPAPAPVRKDERVVQTNGNDDMPRLVPPRQPDPVVQAPAPSTNNENQFAPAGGPVNDAPAPTEPLVRTPTRTKLKDDQNRAKAVEFMQQASALLKAERFVEARKALDEAQGLNATFSAEEETPGQLIQLLMATAQKRINGIGREVHEKIMRKTPEELAAAEAMLNEAEAIAKGLGLSTWAIGEHRGQLRAARNVLAANSVAAAPKLPDAPRPEIQPAPAASRPEIQPVPAAPVQASTAEPETPRPETQQPEAKLAQSAPGRANVNEPQEKPVVAVDPGIELLKQAQAELRANQLENARKIAMEVLNISSVYKDDAQSLIRTIDSEVTLQRRESARRAYERGVECLQARNYEQALSIFRLIEPSLLTPSKQRLMADQIAAATRSMDRANAVVRTGAAAATEPQSPEKIGADSLVKQEEAMRELQFQKFRAEGLQLEASATARFGKGETDLAMQDLNGFVARVNTANIDPAKKALLTRPIESRIERLKVLKHQQDVLTKEAKTLKDFRNQMTQEQLYKANKKEEVAKLMKDFGKLMDEGKFQEAGKVAMQARTLDPEDPMTGAAMQISKMAWRREKWESIKDGKEQYNYDVGNDAHTFGPPVDMEDPYKFDLKAFNRMKNRQSAAGGFGSMKSMTDPEKKIDSKLNTMSVNLKFKNQPLEDVVAYLQTYTGLNFYLDTRAFQADGIDTKLPITVDLNQITLKSALEIVLLGANLKYVIDKEVVRITTQKGARGKLVQRIIPVADLVIPVQNYTPSAVTSLENQLIHGMQNNRPQIGGASTPFTPMMGLGTGQGTPTGTASLTGPGSRQGALVGASTPGGNTVKVESASGTIEESLIHLITSSVQPDTWEAMGGAGRVEYYPLGMALVINQTPDVIEEVGRLLEALRRLQDLEVAIEVRMITLAETFYERIGLDFSMNINTKNREVSTQLGNSSASNSNLTNAQNIGARVIGLAAPGVPTPDLNLPISSSSFGMAVPPFGNYPNAPGLDGGLSLGLAFLSDIQVQMFLEAAQGDRRTNVMQAPKLTMFNGQSANIQIQEQQFFMTGITVTSVNGQLVFTPQNQPFPLGVTMNMQPVVTGDRRFVRLNIQQRMTNLSSATVPLFPITTIVTPVFEGGAQGQPVPFTQYVQQPTFATINVSTTVVVPDGGTVLLGGLKTLNEGRNEFGPPVLSKIPYIDRLFRNVGYGRDVQSLMMMVTPRIIINREEQERQTGVVENQDEAP